MVQAASLRELPVHVGVTGEDAQEDDAVGSDLDHLGDTGVGVGVVDDQVSVGFDHDAGRVVIEMTVVRPPS